MEDKCEGLLRHGFYKRELRPASEYAKEAQEAKNKITNGADEETTRLWESHAENAIIDAIESAKNKGLFQTSVDISTMFAKVKTALTLGELTRRFAARLKQQGFEATEKITLHSYSSEVYLNISWAICDLCKGTGHIEVGDLRGGLQLTTKKCYKCK